MANIEYSQCTQEWEGNLVKLTLVVSGSGTTLDLRILTNPLYRATTYYNVDYTTINGYKYIGITQLYPSSYIEIQVRLDGGAWSSTAKFFIMDDYEYSSEAKFFIMDDYEYSSEYYPPYIPPITHQWVWDRYNNRWYTEAGTCVANALATMKNIQEHKAGVQQYREYSIGWIYGNRLPTDYQGEGMMCEEALERLKTDGVPYYQLLRENANYYYNDYYYPDNYIYGDSTPTGVTAKQLVSNNRAAVLSYAQPQRIASYEYYDGLLVNVVKQHIINDGCVLLYTDLYRDSNGNNNYDLSTGIFTEYSLGSFRDGHMMVAVGWKKINQVNYWICVNSWGNWNGDNGLFYYPFFVDYGHYFYFVTDGNYPYPVPPAPSTAPVGTGRGDGSLSISWGASNGLQIMGYKVKIRRGYDSYTTYKDCGNITNTTLSNLNHGTTYFLSVCAYDRWNYSAYTSETQYTTLPQTPTIYGSTPSNNVIQITLGTMSGDWDYVVVNRFDNNNNYIDSKIITYGNTSVTWSGITGTFKFQARAKLTINGTVLESYNLSNVVTISTARRPDRFVWDTAKISGQPFNVKATEWNRLIQTVRDMYTYKGIPSYTPLMYDVTPGTTFRAIDDFNRVKNAIGYFYNNANPAAGVGISDKSAGNTIYASYLDGNYSIVKKLNDIT